MSIYQYSALANPNVDIRLVKLLPGRFHDDLRIALYHVPLIRPPAPSRVRLGQAMLKELQQTLPAGWAAWENLEGKYFFEDDGGEITTWIHPDPNVPRSSYEAPPAEPVAGALPEYEALSYTWGTMDNPQIVRLQADEHSSVDHSILEIQQNLATALRHLRYPDKSRVLWIDAICINQKDIPERNVQVTRMKDIYRLAGRVVAWLGPESEDSQHALSTLDYLGAQIEYTKDQFRLPAPDCAHPQWFHSYTDLPYREDTWRSILELFRRPWFDRLWVTQEIQLANARAVVKCGSDEIPWSRFRRALYCLRCKRELPYKGLSTRIMQIGALARPLQGFNFRVLLLTFSDRLCSDPRDKVYGLLGLASQEVLSQVRPQYSLPFEEIYRDTFLCLLDQTQRLDSLSECTMRPGRPERLPSWVPDWSWNTRDQAVLYNNTWFASGNSRAHATLHPGGVLEVTGVHVSTVLAVQGPVVRQDTQALAAIRNWAPDDIRTGLYPTGESLVDAFASTMVMNKVKDHISTRGSIPTLQVLRESLLGHLSQPGEGDGVDVSPLSRLATEILRGRVFITTDNGYFGLGPPGTQPGDLVCTILGCFSSIVLRAQPHGAFAVVGGSYVHGLSNGEGVLGPLPAPWQAVFRTDEAGVFVPYFRDPRAGVDSDEDPRLRALDLDPVWECCAGERTRDDPQLYARYRNRDTGEVLNSDPRLLPEALEGRGVALRRFRLV
ncbi:hypothetical protein AAE478_003847 [Parahypoxylon ruwenzoriense]